MEPTDLTIRILQEIRDEQRATRVELQQMNARLETHDARFEVIETALRDMAQQLVMLSRAIKTALESRAESDRRFEALERRLDALEKAPH